MSLSKQQATDIQKCECDLGFKGKSLLSKSDPALIGNVSDENIHLMKMFVLFHVYLIISYLYYLFLMIFLKILLSYEYSSTFCT